MARTQTMVQLSDEIVSLLDREASRRGISRSALIREAVVEHLADTREASVTARIVEGYRSVPPATPDEWGDLETQQDRSTTELLERLDAEERAAGLSPW